MAIGQMGSTTVHVPRYQAQIPPHLLGKITTASPESLADGKTTTELLLMTHCGTVMDVVKATADATRLGCRGSTGPSHRKWGMTWRCACVAMKVRVMKTST